MAAMTGFADGSTDPLRSRSQGPSPGSKPHLTYTDHVYPCVPQTYTSRAEPSTNQLVDTVASMIRTPTLERKKPPPTTETVIASEATLTWSRAHPSWSARNRCIAEAKGSGGPCARRRRRTWCNADTAEVSSLEIDLKARERWG